MSTKTDKTDLWDRLGKTDPAHTKSFQRAGGFKGTAIKPMFSYRRMTEEFGPCGTGWGINEPSFQVVSAADEVLVFCTVSIWHGARENIVYGVGGDKPAGKNRNGTFTDDEAFKKAFTDAVTNALKLIGVGADVHMGLFDDSKYVNAMREEFSDQRESHRDETVQILTVDAQRKIFAELQQQIAECASVESLKRWKVSAKSSASRLSAEWRASLDELYLERKRELEKQEADEYIERKTA